MNRPPRCVRPDWVRLIASACVLAGLAMGAERAWGADETKPAAEKRVGRIVKVTLPIRSETAKQVRSRALAAADEAASRKQSLVLILEFDVPAQQQENARTSDFAACYDLARFLSGSELSAARTVAFFPQPARRDDKIVAAVEGHAVLAAIACDEIVMHPEAEMGAGGVNEKQIDETMRTAYRETAGRRKTVAPELALGMLDAKLEVLEVSTDRDQRRFVLSGDLAELEKKHTVRTRKVLIPAGEMGRFTGRQAWLLGFTSATPLNRREMLEDLGLPHTAVEEDLGGVWRPGMVRIDKPLRKPYVRDVGAAIARQVQENKVNFLVLWIDSPGGDLLDTMGLVEQISGYQAVRTVAYVDDRAFADAALLALACDQIVMRQQALLGGSGDQQINAKDLEEPVRQLRGILTDRKGRSWSLPVALIDPQIELFEYTRAGLSQYLSREEWQAMANHEKWVQGPPLPVALRPVQLTAQSARQFGLANFTVTGFGQLREHYGLKDDPSLAEPNWADQLIRALASPALAALLLAIGFVAMYIELHTPGMGIGGFIATVCFVLFFWSRFLGGTAGWLEVLLFLLGVGCLALEVFVLPGFGIFGLGGGALVLASLILASQTFLIPHNEYQMAQFQRTLWMLLGAVAGTLFAVAMLRRWLPHAPFFNRMLLAPPSPEEAAVIAERENLLDAEALIGASGTTTTPLVPGGKARFGDRIVDVVAEGELVGRGEEVTVVDVQGSRVVVQKQSPPAR